MRKDKIFMCTIIDSKLRAKHNKHKYISTDESNGKAYVLGWKCQFFLKNDLIITIIII
jgi:hypothetical protein